ncbi:hypothetical protein AM592_19240 [Bacillus gobiensis]|uniref:Uncharacterized protein n=1 Tax=Bacillus gobiensis TaxID=1441095 RepID=A0A0M5JF84_9BACI|nr:hypothetical protein AM592_19240 [Bacillus gobiensis]
MKIIDVIMRIFIKSTVRVLKDKKSREAKEKSFIGVLKDKKEQESQGKVLHKGSEGQKGAGNPRKSPS